ncbi:MAG: hypothetical protein RIA09_16000 [Hoeflea sp.]|jgi:hypothetical protein|uniref:hypothetical protein n=1 Tax=Hoeflea sp. TaxID=1940281 RepID=UPI0032EBBF10
MTSLSNQLRELALKVGEIEACENIDFRKLYGEAWGKLLQLWEELGDGPSPMCRDCADSCGICPHSKLPCDPQERAIFQIRQLKEKARAK